LVLANSEIPMEFPLVRSIFDKLVDYTRNEFIAKTVTIVITHPMNRILISIYFYFFLVLDLHKMEKYYQKDW